MKTLHLDRPALFMALGGPVMVDMEDGEPFYHRNMVKGRTFTIPAGTWDVQGGRFLRYFSRSAMRMPRLPDLDITVGDNPNTASVWPATGRVLLDRSVLDLPYPSRVFIILHEAGHYFHRSEEACDRFAANVMKRAGFNPSQISAATNHALSHHAAERHEANDAFARRMDKRRNK